MSTFESLLAQAATSHSDAPETLADTLRKHAQKLTDPDMEVLIAGYREQRIRWSTNQQQGSRERVTAAKVVTRAGKPKPPPIPAGLLLTKTKPVL